jgi:hypothetical protein
MPVDRRDELHLRRSRIGETNFNAAVDKRRDQSFCAVHLVSLLPLPAASPGALGPAFPHECVTRPDALSAAQAQSASAPHRAGLIAIMPFRHFH